MKFRFAVSFLMAPVLLVFSGCAGWTLGVGIPDLYRDGVYMCYGEAPIDPANCSAADAYVCSSHTVSKQVQVESYFSFGDSERRVEVVTVPAQAKAVYGSGPFVGKSDYKRLSGVCATRQYKLTLLP